MNSLHSVMFLALNCLLLVTFGLAEYDQVTQEGETFLHAENDIEFLENKEGERLPREVRYPVPLQKRHPHPLRIFCIRAPCNIAGENPISGPQQGRYPLPHYAKEESSDKYLVDFDVAGTEMKQRIRRDVQFSFPGQNNIPTPPTALCFRQPCNVPGGIRGPYQGRYPRSAIDQEESSDKYLVDFDVAGTEMKQRIRRDVQFSFPGQNNIPPPPTALCFRQPCNVPGGIRGPYQGRYPRSAINQEVHENLMDLEVSSTDMKDRMPRQISLPFVPSPVKIPALPNILCLGQPCKVPGPGGHQGSHHNSHQGSHQNSHQGTFPKLPIISEFIRLRRSANEKESNTRGMLHSTKSFGPNSHGGWQSTATVEHYIWKSKDGNSRFKAFGSHSRIDGGRFDGFKDNKVGFGFEKKF